MLRINRMDLAVATACVGLLSHQAQAITYTYIETTSTTTQWSAGTSWDATPVSAVDTDLIFGAGAVPAAGTAIISNNDIGGNFLLNEIQFTYAAPAAGTAPTVTLTGNPLEFNGPSAQIFYNASGATTNSRPQLIVNNNMVLSSDLTVRVQASGAKPEITLNGAITGNFSTTFTAQAGQTATFSISNSGNDFTGDTRLTLASTSGRDTILNLAASNVIPNGVGRGNLFLAATSEAGNLIVQLNGNTETINGLASNVPSSGSGNANIQRIRNNAATAGTLRVGDNNTTATFVGGLQDGTGGGALNLTKIGSGTQTFSGLATHTGATRIEGGTLKIDYTIFGTSLTSNPSAYFSATSDVTMAGGTTFAIAGRGDGGAIQQTGLAISNAGRSISLPNALASQLVVGQELFLTKTSGTGNIPGTPVFITAIDAPGVTNTLVWGNQRLANGGGLTADVTTNATVGTTAQTLKSLTLSAGVAEVATIDFGLSDSVVLTIGGPPIQNNNGSILSIANWSGIPQFGNGDERLLFVGSPGDFSSVFSQSEVVFQGYGAGYALVPFGGQYEVVALIPEPTLAWLLGGGALALAVRRRRSC